MSGLGLDRTDDFQKILDQDWIDSQSFQIKSVLGLKNFTVRSFLLDRRWPETLFLI